MKPVLVLVALIASFSLGYFLKSSNQTQTIVKEKEIHIKEVPKEVTKEIYIENKEDVAKAKSYYEKAFKLFLANIGYNLNRETESEFNQMMENPIAYSEKEKPKSSIPRELDFIATKEFESLVAKEEADLKSVTDEDLLKKGQKFILKDPALFFARAKLIKNFNDIKSINGEYRATLFRMIGNNKGRVDQIYMAADFMVKEEKKIDGTFTLKMSHGDKLYSDSNGSGGNGNIFFNGKDLVIEAGPSNYFHFKDGVIEEANFYSRGKFIGMAKFNKI